MDNRIAKKLMCVYCKQRIDTEYVFKQTFGIAKCSCSRFPIVNSILYLKNDSSQKRAVELINKRKYFLALIALLQLRKRLLVPIIFLILLHRHKKAQYRISFQVFLRLLVIFGYPLSWARYLANRKRMPSYILSEAVVDYLPVTPKAVIIDAGCGTGQLIHSLGKTVDPKNIIGLDGSFLSLFLAKCFFVSQETLLICTDIENGLPFANKSVTLCFDVESFQHYTKKQQYLSELGRVITPRGVAALIHVFNKNSGRDKNIYPVSPNKLVKLSKNNGFPYIYALPHVTFWPQLIRNKHIDLVQYLETPIKMSYAHSYILSRNLLPKIVPNKFYARLKKIKIDYFQDQPLKQ